MAPRFQSVITVPVPASLSRDRIIAALQNFTILIESQPFVLKHERVPVDLSDVSTDPFFEGNGNRIERYQVVERIDILRLPKVPVYKDVHIDVTFQSIEGGVRSRADAGGVRIYATYFVRQMAQPAQWDLTGSGWSEWELVEQSTVICGLFTKPFVTHKYNKAHQAILVSVIEAMFKKRRESSQGRLYLQQTLEQGLPSQG